MINLIGDPLKQWETGRCIEVATGSNYLRSDIAEIQFANANDSFAMSIPYNEDYSVLIPDRYLQSGKPLTIYLVQAEEYSTYKTVDGSLIEEKRYRSVVLHSKTFPVITRPKPKDYVPSVAEEAYSVVRRLHDEAKKASEEAKEYAETAQTKATEAAGSASTAEHWATTVAPIVVTVTNGVASKSASEILQISNQRTPVYLSVDEGVLPLSKVNNSSAVFEYSEGDFTVIHTIDNAKKYSKTAYKNILSDENSADFAGKELKNVGYSNANIDSRYGAYPTLYFSIDGGNVILRGLLDGDFDDDAVTVRQLTAVQGVVTEHGAEIESAKNRLQNAEEAISYAEQDLEALSGRIGSAESYLTELSIGLDGAEQAISDLEEKSKELETSISNAVVDLETKAEIDDIKVGSDAWSSKNIVDKLCPAFKKTGTVVQCEPLEGTSLKATYNAGGLISITVCGKNLYDPEKYPLKKDFYINLNDGSIRNPTSGKNYAATVVNYSTPIYIPVGHLVGKVITLNNTPGGTSPGMAFFDLNKVYISGGKGNAITVPNGAEYMLFCVDADETENVQIELGTVKSEYEPYWERKATDYDSAVVIANKGINTVVGYDGVIPAEITVTGKADPVAIIDKLTNAVLSLGGNI